VDGSTLWVDASGPDTWVKVLIADDSLINEAFSRRFLRVTFIRDGDPCERVFAGKSVLSAYRLPPEDVAQQVRALNAVKEMVTYLSLYYAIAWFDEDDGGTPFNRDDVDRAAVLARTAR
jgi:hypothetical protein